MKYTYCRALNEFCPEASWSLTDENDLSTISWMSSNVPIPDKDTLDAWIAGKMELEPMRLLRLERNKRLDDCRWVIERAISTGTALPPEWSAYMQALRDLPEHAQPKLDAFGNLDLPSVAWPTKPST